MADSLEATFNTYEEAIAYIDKTSRFGSILGLDRIKKLLDSLGNPEKDLKFIHVAGTNGKGSICTFIASILESSGYRVGRYISPALFEYRERIQINGDYIDEASVTESMTTISRVCQRFLEEGIEHPTIFEIETAMSFMYFKKKACDFVVLEVGLGGRFDSTNAIASSLISVIGAIGLDHTDILGDSLGAIAFEKAGIIKACQPVVIYAQDQEAVDVIMAQCIRKKSKPALTDWEQLSVKESIIGRQTFDYKQHHNMEITLTGMHQVKNAATAIEVIEQLAFLGYTVDESAMKSGLKSARWPGRFQIIHQKPMMIVDGAHNPDGAKALADCIKMYFKNKKVILVMGVFLDKDYSQILEIMSSCGETLIVYKPNHQRGLSSEILAAEAEDYFEHVDDGVDVHHAISIAIDNASEEDVIISFGSLSTIGEICDIMQVKLSNCKKSTARV